MSPPKAPSILPPLERPRKSTGNFHTEETKTPSSSNSQGSEKDSPNNLSPPSTIRERRSSSIVYTPSPEIEAGRDSEDRTMRALSIPFNELAKRHSLQALHLGNRFITRDIAAKEEGILPLSLLATQLSTQRQGNTCAYRSNGPIPRNLYMKYLSGDAEPKPFSSKAKSSTEGPQEGHVVVTPGFTRVMKTENGYELRKHGQDELPRHPDGSIALKQANLTVTLRSIYEDAYLKTPPKYVIDPDNNPDKNNIFRFQQINHESPYVLNTIYSIDLSDSRKEKIEEAKSDLLVSKIADIQVQKGMWESPNFPLKQHLDFAFPVSGQAPNSKKEEIIIIDHMVRDTDVDFFTQPTQLNAAYGKTEEAMSEYVKPINMNHGQDPHATFEDIINMRMMLNRIFELNQMEWKQYQTLVNQRIEEANNKGKPFNESDLADKKPYIDKFETPKDIQKFVVLVGEATPLEIYQGLEINAITQKIVTLKKENPNLNIDDFTKPHTTLASQHLLKNIPLRYDGKTLAQFFIQHPTECRNKTDYTCDRGTSVMILKGRIVISNSDHEITNILKSNANHELVNINPKWLTSEKPEISGYAKDWMTHFLSHTQQYANNSETLHAVDTYLKKNPEFSQLYLRDPHAHTQGKHFIQSFLEKNPELKDTTQQNIQEERPTLGRQTF